MTIFFKFIAFIKDVFLKPDNTFKTKLDSLNFPITDERINWHMKAIRNSLYVNDFNLANNSYAKLVECVRQQIEDKIEGCEEALIQIQYEYDDFRKTYQVEFPKKFIRNKNLKIDTADYGAILDKHFELNDRIQEYYKKREFDEYLEKSILACEEQIKLSSEAKKHSKENTRESPCQAIVDIYN